MRRAPYKMSKAAIQIVLRSAPKKGGGSRGAKTTTEAEDFLAGARHVLQDAALVVLVQNGRLVTSAMKLSSMLSHLVSAAEIAAGKKAVPARLDIAGTNFTADNKHHWELGFAQAMRGDELYFVPMEGILASKSALVRLYDRGAGKSLMEQYVEARDAHLKKASAAAYYQSFATSAAVLVGERGVNLTELMGRLVAADRERAAERFEAVLAPVVRAAHAVLGGAACVAITNDAVSQKQPSMMDLNPYLSTFVSKEPPVAPRVAGSYTTLLKAMESVRAVVSANPALVAAGKPPRHVTVDVQDTTVGATYRTHVSLRTADEVQHAPKWGNHNQVTESQRIPMVAILNTLETMDGELFGRVMGGLFAKLNAQAREARVEEFGQRELKVLMENLLAGEVRFKRNGRKETFPAGIVTLYKNNASPSVTSMQVYAPLIMSYFLEHYEVTGPRGENLGEEFRQRVIQRAQDAVLDDVEKYIRQHFNTKRAPVASKVEPVAALRQLGADVVASNEEAHRATFRAAAQAATARGSSPVRSTSVVPPAAWGVPPVSNETWSSKGSAAAAASAWDTTAAAASAAPAASAWPKESAASGAWGATAAAPKEPAAAGAWGAAAAGEGATVLPGSNTDLTYSSAWKAPERRSSPAATVSAAWGAAAAAAAPKRAASGSWGAAAGASGAWVGSSSRSPSAAAASSS